MNKETDAPTITLNDYIFFGKIDVYMKAANGTGVVSSFVLESDDLDEIDWVSSHSSSHATTTNINT